LTTPRTRSYYTRFIKSRRPAFSHKIQYSSAHIRRVEKISNNLHLVEAFLEKELYNPEPPQFVMTWIPGYEAIPLSIALYRRKTIWFLVKPVGETTHAMTSRSGYYIGLYGPLGRPLLPLDGYRYLFIAGGSGIAPIIHYADKLCRSRSCDTVYCAWRSGEVGKIPELMKNLGTRVATVCMDHGCDVKGLASDAIRYLRLEDYDYIVVSGSRALIDSIVENIDRRLYSRTIVVLESRVKCGLGLCGECRISEKSDKLLCVDGPGFYLSEVTGDLGYGE
jgi:dihydroorotate dehydrogenase electron transfer subunit